MIRQTTTKTIKDRDGRARVWGWVNLAAPEKARRLAEAKPLWGTMPTKVLSVQCGIPTDALRRAFDEPYRLRICERVNLARQYRANGVKGLPKADGTPQHFTERRVDEQDVAARLAEIPEDTRTVTGRICGDPIPGRSALDRRIGQ